MDSTYEELALSRTFRVYRQTVEETAYSLADASASAPLVVGEILEGKYRIERLLGRGGMGAVYAATHMQLQKPVAVKALLARAVDNEAFERFHREALSLGKFRHKHIVEVFDFGTLSEKPYFTMEMLSGASLAERMAEKRLAPDRVLEVFTEVAEALEYAHKVDIIHRDIKPGNIFLSINGSIETVKLVDFGLAKLLSQGNTSGAQRQQTTQVGTIFGSPLYMSPEQSSGQLVDRRTDIYSYGCALFEALTGRPPFTEASAIETIMAHQLKKTPTLKEMAPGVEYSARLEALVARTLKKDPVSRFQDFGQILSELKLVSASGAVKSARAEMRHAAASQPEANSSIEDQKSKLPVVLLIASALLLTSALGIGLYIFEAPGKKGAARKIIGGGAKIKNAPAGTGANTSKEVASEKIVSEPVTPELVTIDVKTRPSSITMKFSPHRGKAWIVLPGGRKISCTGVVTLPAGVQIGLECQTGVSPEFLAAWPADTLETVWLNNASWPPAHLAALKKQTHLKKLHVRGSELEEGFPQALHALKSLELLDVTDSVIKGSELAPLASWPNLKALYANSISDALLALNGASPPSFTSLHFTGNNITDADLPMLAQRLPHLTELSLNSNKIEGPGLEALVKLNLKTFSLEFMKIGPEAIGPLSKMTHLQSLTMPADGLSPRQIQKLKESLPANCWRITNLRRLG